MIRTIVYWGLYWGPLVLGNYHRRYKTLRVQGLGYLTINHIPVQNLYYNYHYPKPKYLNLGYLDLLGECMLSRIPFWGRIGRVLVLGGSMLGSPYFWKLPYVKCRILCCQSCIRICREIKFPL